MYVGSEMTVIQLVDSTSALTERMKMSGISNAEYTVIDDITITGYTMGTDGVSTNLTEVKNQGNIQIFNRGDWFVDRKKR